MSVLMSKDKDPESRKWLLTINNPVEKGFTHEYIKEQLSKLKLLYWCMSDEVGGTEHTFHTHVYIVRGSGIRATRIAKLFPFVHRDIARGTSQENKDYVFKQGKWLNTEKETTNIKDSHEEWGEMPIERPGARNDSLENYVKRLEELENIGNSIEGVDKTFAMQAGRELRVMVKPEEIDDLSSYKIAREIKDKIEETMQYPGTIKVVVIRETRAEEVAK